MFFCSDETKLNVTTDTLNVSQREPDFITRLFTGTHLTVIEVEESDGSPVLLRNRAGFGSLILPVSGTQPSDVYTALDRYTVSDLEMTTPKGRRVAAKSSLWLERLPRVLMLQESRVQYSTLTCEWLFGLI